MRVFRKAAATAVAAIAAICIASATPASAALSDKERAHNAVEYIASEQMGNGSIPAFSPIGSTADAVLSFVAAGTGRDQVKRALNYLKRQTEQGNVLAVGLQAKVVVAAVAGGRKPRSFGGVNLVTGISGTEQPDGRYGQNTAVFDQALAILALDAAGATPSANALGWLANAQCPDGGWQYDAPWTIGEDEHCFTGDFFTDYFESDTNTSSLAVQALEATGGPAPANDPFDFFVAIRDPQFGGWGYTWGFQTTDANSTTLVIQAYIAAGLIIPPGVLEALRQLQYPKKCGAFAFTWIDDGAGGFIRTGPDVGATIGTPLSLFRRALPVAEKHELLILITPNIVCPS